MALSEPMRRLLWEDYLAFHRLALETKDVDPVYPVLRRFLEERGYELDSDDALWLSVAHVTWYDLGSALAAWHLTPLDQFAPDDTLRCATERRGNRDPKQLKANLASWRDAAASDGGLKNYLTAGLPDYPPAAWVLIQQRIRDIHGNGRWAAYKLAEILQKVNGLPLEPVHMGHANSSGPRRGLELLIDNLPQGDSLKEINQLDEISDAFVAGINGRGITARIEEVETTLCDFHALHEGRYYVGNDIDQMLGQLYDGRGYWTDEVLQARYDTLPHAYLGELGGWAGVDRDRQKAYRDRHEILVR